MQTLRPHLRSHVVVLAFLVCLTLAFVTLTNETIAARIFWGLMSVTLAITLIAEYRIESAFANLHFTAMGEITKIVRKRRGRTVEYRFVAADGKGYRGESDSWSWNVKTREGTEVLVVYDPHEPSRNKPASSFLFYSLDAM